MSGNLSITLKLSADGSLLESAIRTATGDIVKMSDATTHSADVMARALSTLDKVRTFGGMRDSAAQAEKALAELSKQRDFLLETSKKFGDGGLSGFADAIKAVKSEMEQAKASIKSAASSLSSIDAFKKLQSDADKAAASLAELKRKREFLLSGTEGTGDAGLKAFSADLESTRKAILSTAKAAEAKKAALRDMDSALSKAGIDTGSLASEESRLAAAMAKGNADISAGKMRIADLQSVTKRSADSMRELNRDIDANRRAVTQAERALNAKNDALRTMESTLKRVGVDTANLAGEETRLAGSATAAKRKIEELAASGKSAGGALGQGMSSANAGIQSTTGLLGAAKTALVAFFSVQAVSSLAATFVDYATKISDINARIRLATKSEAEYVAVKNELVAITRRTGTELGANASLYVKVSDSFRQMGRSQREALQFTEALAQSLRISGANTQEAAAATLQLSQALGSGVLRGDEFNSMMENSPRFAKALAEGLGKPVGALRTLAEEGKLTADVVVNALMNQKDKLAAEYAQLPRTVGQAMNDVKTSFMLWAEEVDKSNGITKNLSAALEYVAAHFNTIASTVKLLGEVALIPLAARWLPAAIAGMKAFAVSITVAEAAAKPGFATLMKDIWEMSGHGIPAAKAQFGALGAAARAFAAVGVTALASWEFGTWLRNFESVRQAGVAMASGIHVAIATLTGSSKKEIQQIKDQYFELFQAETDAAQKKAANDAVLDEKKKSMLQATKDQVKKALEEEKAAYKALTESVQQDYAAQTQAIAQQLQQRLAMADATIKEEGKRESEKLAAVQEAHAAQLAALQDHLTKSITLIEQEHKAELAAASASGESQKTIDAQALEAKRKLLSDTLKAYEDHYAQLAQKYTADLEKVKQVEEEKRQFKMSTEETIRELNRSVMSDYRAYQDKQTEIAQLQMKSRQALAEQDYAKAKEMAEKAIALAKSSAQAVKDGDTEMVTKKQAVWTATEKIRTSEELVNKALDGQAKAAKEGAEATKSAMDETQGKIEKLGNSIKVISDALKSGFKMTIESNADLVKKGLDELNGHNTSSTHTVHVVKDGNIPGDSSSTSSGAGGYAKGGFVRAYADGGPVFKAPRWSKVPGVGNEDSVPAALPDGSFVVRKAAAEYYGDARMEALARGLVAVRKFASGGSVSTIGGKVTSFSGDSSDGGQAQGDDELASLMRRLNQYISEINQENVGHWGALGKPIDVNEYIRDMQIVGVDGKIDKERLKHILDGMRDGRDRSLFWGAIKKAGFFAEGGYAEGKDTVPAMLMPGEFVVTAPATSALAKAFGGSFLDNINNMRIPREALTRMGTPPTVARFADGGLVGERGKVSLPLATSSGQSGPDRTIRIELSDKAGRKASGSFSERDAGAFVSILKAAGARTN